MTKQSISFYINKLVIELMLFLKFCIDFVDGVCCILAATLMQIIRERETNLHHSVSSIKGIWLDFHSPREYTDIYIYQ